MTPVHIRVDVSVGKKVFTAHLHLDPGLPADADRAEVHYLIQQAARAPMDNAAVYLTEQKEQSNDEG